MTWFQQHEPCFDCQRVFPVKDLYSAANRAAPLCARCLDEHSLWLTRRVTELEREVVTAQESEVTARAGTLNACRSALGAAERLEKVCWQCFWFSVAVLAWFAWQAWRAWREKR